MRETKLPFLSPPGGAAEKPKPSTTTLLLMIKQKFETAFSFAEGIPLDVGQLPRVGVAGVAAAGIVGGLE